MYVKAIVRAGILAICVGVAATVGGCGDDYGTTSEVKDSAVVKDSAKGQRIIRLSSPILANGKTLPGSFTCDPKAVWLPLRWSGVPDKAEELVLYGARVRHEDTGDAGVATLVSAVLIGGLPPAPNKLAAGPPPDDAFFISGPRPETLCLPGKPDEELTFQLYALAPGQRLDRSSPQIEEVLRLFERALAVGSIFAPFSSSPRG
jgi:hypothetical protein